MNEPDKSYLPAHKRVTDPPKMRLTARDKEIVLAVYQYRLLSSQQIEALLFPSTGSKPHSRRSACQRRLQLLFHHGYLARIAQPLMMGEGRAPFVYALDEAGANLVAAHLGLDRARVQWKLKDNQVGALFLDHLLAINDARVVFSRLADAHQWQIATWIDDTAFRSAEMQEKVPYHMRGARMVRTYPDSYFTIEFRNPERRLYFFLEVDRATMSNTRWQGKIKSYVQFRATGQSQSHYGTRKFRVLIVTTSKQRLDNLNQATEAAGGVGYFWFTTQESVDIWQPEKLLEPVWTVAGDVSSQMQLL